MENNIENKTNTSRIGITASTLSIIAMVTMLIDHCGYVLFNNEFIMRAIGRIAFPIYGFMLVEGYYKTSNKVKYFLKMMILAILTEPIFDSLFLKSLCDFKHQNVLFELAFGIVLVHSVNKIRESTVNFSTIKYIGYTLLLGSVMVASEILNFDYGAIGLVMVLIFAIGYNTKLKWLTTILGVVIPYVFLFKGNNVLGMINILGFELPIYLQTYAVLTIPFILLYNGQKGISNKTFKTFKYLFYPVHLLILYLIIQIGG